MLYGIGSCYGSTEEMMGEFINKSVACIGWAPEFKSIHGLFSQITIGDIVFLKSFPAAHGLYIKAIGVVLDHKKYDLPKLGTGVDVHWIWHARSQNEYIKMGRLNDKYDNMRSGSVYQEYNPDVLNKILDKIEN